MPMMAGPSRPPAISPLSTASPSPSGPAVSPACGSALPPRAAWPRDRQTRRWDHHVVRACRAADRGRCRFARRRRHRRPARPRLFAGLRHRRRRSRQPPRRLVARCAANGRRRRGPRLVGTGATLLAAAWPAGERLPRSSSSAARPTSTGWRRSAPPCRRTAPPKPLYLSAPDAQPLDSATRPADDRISPPTVRPRHGRRLATPARATPAPSPRCTLPHSTAAGARTKSRGAARRAHGAGHSRLWRASSWASSCRAAPATKRRSCPSRWRIACRGRGLARNFCIASAAACRRWRRAVFLEVDETNRPALRLYRRAGFREVGRRPNYYPSRARHRQPPPWCYAAISADRRRCDEKDRESL